MYLQWVLLAALLFALSGIPGVCRSRSAAGGGMVSTLATLLASLLGLHAVLAAWIRADVTNMSLAWQLPLGRVAIGMDGVTSFFLLPIFVVSALGAVYGAKYWSYAEHPESAARLRFFYGLLAGAMVLVVLARDSVLFLMAWEVMALAAFFLVTTEDDDAGVCRAGWIYLIATHLGTLCLIAMFAILRGATGSFAIQSLTAKSLSPGIATAVFVLTVIGFGLKAGIMPLHVWLPGAHASAPSHVSAVMSGVMIKMGIYGIIRICGLFPEIPVGWGVSLLVLGAISALFGAIFAVVQNDLKRLLAYCSIENIGIILLGLGLAMLGRSLHRNDWIVLGFAGALLHVWNHSLFKSLLFYGAGSIIHAVHTRQMDQMGGLAKKMPKTFVLFLLGSVAICGLPPLNGFVSEFMVYLGLFRTMNTTGGNTWVAAITVVPVLAMTGALACAAFVKTVGTVFLGLPRSDASEHAHDAPAAMNAAMVILAFFCFSIAFYPVVIGPILDQAVQTWMPAGGGPTPQLITLAPLRPVGIVAAVLAVVVVAGIGCLWRSLKKGAFQTVGTWDCGYTAPSARMQYTGSSLSQIFVALFSPFLRAYTTRPQIQGLFPDRTRFDRRIEDFVLQYGVLPLFRAGDCLLTPLRSLQQGRIQMYILYILLIAMILLAVIVWSSGGVQ